MGKRGPKGHQQAALLAAQKEFIAENNYPASIAKLAKIIGISASNARRSAVHMRDAGLWRQKTGSAKYWPS